MPLSLFQFSGRFRGQPTSRHKALAQLSGKYGLQADDRIQNYAIRSQSPFIEDFGLRPPPIVLQQPTTEPFKASQQFFPAQRRRDQWIPTADVSLENDANAAYIVGNGQLIGVPVMSNFDSVKFKKY